MKTTSTVLRQVTKSVGFEERRRHARLDVPVKANYRVPALDTDSRGAKAKDVSAGGCLLVTTEDIPLGSKVEIEMFLGEDKAESFNVTGRIIRVWRNRKGSYEFGIAFDRLSTGELKRFADYVFTKMYGMVGLTAWPTTREIKKEGVC